MSREQHEYAAARVAQVGYTAVIDRMTPQLSFDRISANVLRSVGAAGGEATTLPALSERLSPSWQRGAVILLDEDQLDGELGTRGTLAFAISVAVDGLVGAAGATAVLHDPSAALTKTASELAQGLQSALDAVRIGFGPAELRAAFARRHAETSLILLRLADAATPLTDDERFAEGDIIAIGAHAQTADGAILFLTSVLIDASGGTRLDQLPLRLIVLQ